MDFNDENSEPTVSDLPVEAPVYVEPEPQPQPVDVGNVNIAEVQTKLGSIPVTGEFDERTRLRVVKLQRRWGLVPNGELNQETLERINAL